MLSVFPFPHFFFEYNFWNCIFSGYAYACVYFWEYCHGWEWSPDGSVWLTIVYNSFQRNYQCVAMALRGRTYLPNAKYILIHTPLFIFFRSCRSSVTCGTITISDSQCAQVNRNLLNEGKNFCGIELETRFVWCLLHALRVPEWSNRPEQTTF